MDTAVLKHPLEKRKHSGLEQNGQDSSPGKKIQLAAVDALGEVSNETATAAEMVSIISTDVDVDKQRQETALVELRNENLALRQRLTRYIADHKSKEEAEKALMSAFQEQERHHLNDPNSASARQIALDPTWVVIYKRMRKALEEKSQKIENLQKDLIGKSFTPYSATGMKLLNKLKAMQIENEELGKELSQSHINQLKTTVGVQKAKIEDLENQIKEMEKLAYVQDAENEKQHLEITRLQIGSRGSFDEGTLDV